MERCFLIDPDDNVATMIQDGERGSLEIVGGEARIAIKAREAIALGHKIAVKTIHAGGRIVKYGVTIGVATHTIHAGDWVHLHNCKSLLDERSGGFDLETGAAKDTLYG